MNEEPRFTEALQALHHTTTLYLTTYNPSGQSGTVPVWFFCHQEHIYFCTQSRSLKVRRLRQTERATLHIGQRNGPRLECTAALLAPDTALQTQLIHTYRRRYWLRWLFLGRRIRRGFASGDELIVQLTPLRPGASDIP